jgi:ribonucleoside-diphosphate reductase alpha chain
MDNNRLIESNPSFETAVNSLGENYDKQYIMDRVAEHGSAREVEELPDDIRRIFATAHDISPEWHIRTQGIFQKYVDNAVSKTVNFSGSATKDDIRKVYDLAYELNCKGVTVYRDGSGDNQVSRSPLLNRKLSCGYR